MAQVYQKVKDVSTRERSIRGGTVFVVRQDVMERLGVEPTSTVELKPSPAEIAAAAAASAQEAGVDGEGSGGAVSTPPRNGKNVSSEQYSRPEAVNPRNYTDIHLLNATCAPEVNIYRHSKRYEDDVEFRNVERLQFSVHFDKRKI